MKIDTKFRGWLRTIHWMVQPLGILNCGKWYIQFTVPSFKVFYSYVKYVLRKSQRCIKCDCIVPAWQYGSCVGSDGQTCAQCREQLLIEGYYAKIQTNT